MGLGAAVGRVVSETTGAIGTTFVESPTWAVAIGLTAVTVVKEGVEFETANIRDAYLPAAQALPSPSGYFSASVGNLLVARLVGVESAHSWVVLHLALIGLALLASFVVASRGAVVQPTNYGILIVAVMAGAVGMTTTVGKYDPLTFAGAFVLAFASSHTIAAAGALLMAVGNPEQAAVASLGLLVLTFATRHSRMRSRAWLALVVSGGAVALVNVWFLAFGQMGNRATLIPGWLAKSLELRWSEGFAGVWSWYGVGWLLVAAALMGLRGTDRWVAVVALVVIPTCVTLVTVDGARVFALTALPAFAVAVSPVFADSAERGRFAYLGALVLLFLLLPL